MKHVIAAAAAGMVLMLSGCGNEDSGAVETVQGAEDGTGPTASGPAPNDPASPDPDTPLSAPADPLASPDEGEPELVEPRPGMDNVRPVSWESAEPRSERVVRVVFYGGVEPCDVLDSVEVDYRAEEVVISLFSGSDPAYPDAVCIELAKLKAVDVELDEDLDGREIIDGNAN